MGAVAGAEDDAVQPKGTAPASKGTAPASKGTAPASKGTAPTIKSKAIAAKNTAESFWRTQRGKRPWLDHAVRAYQQLNHTNGSLLAGALTFISFLSLVPMLILAVSVSAVVLKSHPHTLQEVLDKIEAQAPGGLGAALKSAIRAAVDNSTTLGVAGIFSVAMTGLSWISDLRTATEQVWEHPPLNRNYLKGKVADLFVLAGLGTGLLLSVALTVAASALTEPLIHLLSLGGSAIATVLTRVVGILAAVLAATLVLGLLLIRLPRAKVPRGTGIRAAVMAGIGVECLNLSGTYYIKSVTKSPTAAAFGSLVGVLVFLNLVFRFLLYCTAWTATGTPNDPLAARDEVPTVDSGANQTADLATRRSARQTAGGAEIAAGAGTAGTAGAAETARAAETAGTARPTRTGNSRGVALAVTAAALVRRRRR